MGQQQLLLIILGVIVVGIAVAVGITMFSDSAISANRDALTNDLVNLAARAQQYYRRPVSLGGGGNSWSNLASINQLTSSSTNANGSFAMTATSTKVDIDAYGTEQVGGLPVQMHCIVLPSRDSVYQVN